MKNGHEENKLAERYLRIGLMLGLMGIVILFIHTKTEWLRNSYPVIAVIYIVITALVTIWLYKKKDIFTGKYDVQYQRLNVVFGLTLVGAASALIPYLSSK